MFDEHGELRTFVRRHRLLFQVIVGVIALELALVLYSGVWPPLYVVKSDSMQHSDVDSMFGVIDAGDLLVVRRSDGGSVRTYVECYPDGDQSFGDYGDVIIYDRYGYSFLTPVVHRAMLRVEYNESDDSFDIPSLAGLPLDKWGNGGYEEGRWWRLDRVVEIYDVGYRSATLRVNLSSLISYYRSSGLIHDGLITMGDHNVVYVDGEWQGVYDQSSLALCRAPIKDEWIVGEASVEIPWLGLIRLYLIDGMPDRTPENSRDGLTALFLILATWPVIFDVTYNILRRRGWDPWAPVRTLWGRLRERLH